jgi:DNA-binding transcriptional MerR regulator
MYTVAKLAKLLGVSQGELKKLIELEEIEPDEVRGGCKYYSEETAEEIEELLEEGE